VRPPMKRSTVLLLVFAITAFAAESYEQLLHHFDYDRSAPVDVREVAVQDRGDVKVHDISYASPKGGSVPAYLVVPAGKGPFAAVIFGHWYMPGSQQLNRTEFLDEAVVLARAGVVSLLTDGPIARPGHVEDKSPLNVQQVDDIVQQTDDFRRGADLLLARKDVDPNRLAYVGHSYDAMIGAMLSGIDKRFKAFVLMAGGLNDEIDLKSKEYQDYRHKVGPEKFDAFVAKYSWTNPALYVSHAAPAFVFCQYATQEPFLTPDRARQYFEVVSDPKKMEIYDAPHALNAEATRDRITFLTQQLSLKPLDPKLVASIPELKQPPWPKN
jgi:dienelactone hydrolase